MIRLIFKTKNYPILELKVDLPRKQVSTEKVHDLLAAKIVLQESARTYSGLESRLQYFMLDTRPLPELLDHIKVHGFYVPNQHNLDVDLIEIVEIIED